MKVGRNFEKFQYEDKTRHHSKKNIDSKVMAGPWQQYKAPNGRKYYYNVETKETTWTNPYQKVNVEKKPSFVIPLLNDWFLIIFDNGGKLYLYEDQLYTRLEDEESLELLDHLNKDKLVLLIGISRGYSSLKSSDEVYDSIINEIESYNQSGIDIIEGNEITDDIGIDDIGVNEPLSEKDKESPSENDQVETMEPSLANALIADYSSSDEDDDESDDDYNGHIDKKVKLDEEPLSTEIDQLTINQYKEMFTQHKLNPYSLWSMEMNKCSDDPIFFSVTNDQDREAIYETWCGEYESGKEEGDEDNKNEEEEELIPTKFHYLSHVMSKSNISNDTIFEDIKNENKPMWKQFRINKMIPDKKEQREFVTKLLFYYKKYTQEERIELFIKWVKKYSNLDQSIDIKTLNHWEELHSHEDSSQKIETLLFLMERHLNITEILSTHQTSICYEYYILGIKAKCDTLYSLLVTDAVS